MGNSWLETISTCGTSVTYKLDTGAQVNIMPRRVYSQLPSKPPIQPAHVKIFAYGSTAPLPVDGQCTCDVVVNGGASRLLRFYLVSADSEPLLSLNACEELGLIQRLCVTNGVRPHTNAAAGLNGTIEELSSDHVVKDYVDLFQGIGMLKDYPYMIRVKEEAIPRIVATPRRVPFPLLRKVQDELQTMLTEGIVEEVVDPTPWVSPMVPVLKKDGTVRMC